MSKHILESKLRPAVEFYSASVFFSAVTLCVYSPWAIALAPSIGLATGGCYALAGAIRFKQGSMLFVTGKTSSAYQSMR